MNSEKVVDSVIVPDVPVTVTVAAPVVAVLLAVSVSTLLPVAGLAPKVPVTPLGNPATARVTLPENPFSLETVMVSVADFPWPRDKEGVAGSIVKPGVVEAAPTNVVMLCAGSE